MFFNQSLHFVSSNEMHDKAGPDIVWKQFNLHRANINSLTTTIPVRHHQDASALHLGSILTVIPQFRMLLPSIWAPSSLSNTSVRDASALHLGSILTANTSVQDASALTSGLHPHCQIPQFRMLLSSLLGSILTAKYLSPGYFCPHFWAPSSLQESLLTTNLPLACVYYLIRPPMSASTLLNRGE